MQLSFWKPFEKVDSCWLIADSLLREVYMKCFKILSSLVVTLLLSASFAQTTLTYAIWDNNQLPAHEQIVEAFQAEHPDIQVKIEVVPWESYWEKIQTAAAGGELYDVFWMNGPNFPVYASKGVLTDLKDLIAKDSLDTSVYPQAMLDLYTLDGDVYGLPKDFDTIGLYYNKDMFDAAGVEYPNADWTWDDFSKAAAALTKDGNWGFASTLEDQPGYWNWIYANDGQVIAEDGSKVLLDSPADCDTMKFLYGFVERGESPDGATLSSIDPSTQLFPGGRVAMITSGSWMARTYADAEPNIGVAPIPMGKKHATIIHGLSNVIWSGTQHPAEAWEFLKFLGGETAATILAQSGTVIPAYQGMQQAWVEAIPEMDLQVFIDAIDYAVPYPTAAKGMEWNDKVNAAFTEAWNSNITIDDACKMAAEEANSVLSQ
jgi:multiple sugar transport system substrate-binding protein